MKWIVTIGFWYGSLLLLGQSNITQGEYFFDSDPGIGAGMPIPNITGTPSIDLDFDVDIAGISVGPHSMGIRLMDENGSWSMIQYQSIWVLSSDPLVVNSIVELEYYFDSDPGTGLGVKIPVVVGTAIDVNSSIDASVLSAGMHVLYVRAKNDAEEWSVIHSAAFYVSDNDPFSIANIDRIEYFLDIDPGIGNGIPINTTSSSTINLDEMIDVSSLDLGNHFFNLRMRAVTGEWSMVYTTPFYINVDYSVTVLEHFIDNDPGNNNGTIVSVVPVADTIELDLLLPTASLPVGPHTLNARIGQNSTWGITETVPFVLCDGAIAQISADKVCEGEATNFSDLSSNVIAGDLYSWDFDSDGNEDATTVGNASFLYSGAGIYTSTLTIDRLGCPGTGSVSVTVDTLVTLSGTVQSPVIFGESGTVGGEASGTTVSVLWTSDGSGTFTDETQLVTGYIPSIKDGVNGSVNLTLSAIHPGSCQIADLSLSMEVTLPSDLKIKVYNALSPNGDGKHDFIEIENIEAYPNNTVVIFNRWGDKVGTIRGYNNEDAVFDGVYNKKLLPSGTYFYEIDLGIGTEIIKGFLTLNRDS